MRFVAAALLALTTVLVGFAHRPIGLATNVDVTAAYALPDGSPLDFCRVADGRASDDGAPPAHGAFDGHCDACLLSGAPGLGAVAEIVLPVPGPIALVRGAVAAQVAAGRVLRAPVSRGPPRVA
jgi:hypothetical protein